MVVVIAVILVLAGIAGMVLAVGWLLPVKHYCARSAVFRQPVDAVWAVIADPAGYPAWRKDVKRVELLPAPEGRMRWREESGERPLTFEVERSEPPRRLVTRIVDRNLPFGGGWTFDLVPEGEGCRLTIREDGEIYNPFFRFMARFVFGYHRTLENYLKAIGARFGESVRPEPAPTWG
jgi:hypothetical protein